MNLDLWYTLPTDLVNYILLFDNVIRYRRGKYINQISNSSNIYNLLLKIPRPIVEKYIMIRNNIVYTIKTYFYNENKQLLFILSCIVVVGEDPKDKKIYVTHTIFEKLGN